jgi:hypothetical protein
MAAHGSWWHPTGSGTQLGVWTRPASPHTPPLAREGPSEEVCVCGRLLSSGAPLFSVFNAGASPSYRVSPCSRAARGPPTSAAAPPSRHLRTPGCTRSPPSLGHERRVHLLCFEMPPGSNAAPLPIWLSLSHTPSVPAVHAEESLVAVTEAVYTFASPRTVCHAACRLRDIAMDPGIVLEALTLAALHRVMSGLGFSSFQRRWRAWVRVREREAARGWAHPPDRHFKNQCCDSLGSGFEVALHTMMGFRDVSRTLTRTPLTSQRP